MARTANVAVLAHAVPPGHDGAYGSDHMPAIAEHPGGSERALHVTGAVEGLDDEELPLVEPAAGFAEQDQTSDTEVYADIDGDPTPSLRLLSVQADAPAATAVDEPADVAPQNTLKFRSWSSRYVVAVAGLDTVVGLLAVLLTGAIVGATPLSLTLPRSWVLAGALIWPLAIALVRGYERTRVGIGGDEMRSLPRAAVVIIVVSAIPSGLFEWEQVLTVVVVTAPIAIAFSLALRFASRKRLHARQKQGQNVRNVVVVGSVAAAADLCLIVDQEKHCGMKVVGVCVPGVDVAAARDRGMTVLGDLEQVPAAIKEFGCDAVAVTSGDSTRHNFLRELSWALEGTEVELLVHPGLIEVAGPRMHIRPLVGLPLLYVEQPHFTGWRRLVKRATDIIMAGVGLLVISPVLAVIAAAIKLQDGGPVIFRQTRVGMDGRAFTMLKFRSMVVDAEARKAALAAYNEGAGPLFKIRHDPRITRLGRFLRDFSLDELPQLVNVLGGSMSLVGPRPQLKSEVDLLPADARRRLLVTPGVTGLWQVSGRSDLAWEEAVRLDLRYVENWSLTMDLHILWKTVHAVMTKHGSS